MMHWESWESRSWGAKHLLSYEFQKCRAHHQPGRADCMVSWLDRFQQPATASHLRDHLPNIPHGSPNLTLRPFTRLPPATVGR